MSLLSDFHILSKAFKRLPEREQKFIILSNQENLWNTMKEKVQSVVLTTWINELYDIGMIDYSNRMKTKVDIIEGKNFHLILSGINGSTEHCDFPCGCKLLYNNLIQQYLLVEPHNECQTHVRTNRIKSKNSPDKFT